MFALGESQGSYRVKGPRLSDFLLLPPEAGPAGGDLRAPGEIYYMVHWERPDG